MVALGIGGFLAAVGLTLGALALAGGDTGAVVQPRLSESEHPSATPSAQDRGSGTPSASPDDHGGSGSDDPGGSDSSGPGSDDSSGPGDGSGSDDSSGPGSGSDDSSGSGSGDIDDD